jgi:hypothetical protein
MRAAAGKRRDLRARDGTITTVDGAAMASAAQFLAVGCPPVASYSL